ncbi:MAG: pseudouridine synthase [Bacillota bacterium]|nr:pseudouridine synthase [Bacillota bacterium]
MRIDALLARSGLGSRREVARLIRSGAVTLDGRPLSGASAAVNEEEALRLCLNGEPLELLRHHHLLLNKPAGVLTALRDARWPTVGDWLSPVLLQRGVAPVGRLDRDTTGLLLLTSDGQLAHRLMSPRWGIEKEYRVRHAGEPLTTRETERFAAGMELADGPVRPCRLEVLTPDTALIVVTEGRNRLVRRLFDAIGRPVLTLERLRVGPQRLSSEDAEGELRRLSPGEITALYEAVELREPGLFD